MLAGLAPLLWTQLLQVTVIAIVAWIIWQAFAKNRPHFAHAIWALVLLKCLTPPVFSSPTSPFCWIQRAETQAAEQSTANQTPTQHAQATDDSSKHAPIVFRVNTDQPPDSATAATTSDLPWQSHSLLKPTSLHWYLWSVGGILGLVFVAVRYLRFVRLIHSHSIVDNTLAHQIAEDLCEKLGIKRRVRLLVIDGPIGPAVLGIFRPTILIPAVVIDGKTRPELEPLIAHELIHVRRGDLWWSLLQSIAKCVWWFHPLVWLSGRMLTREAEQSCDEETVASLRCAPSLYARCLLDVLEQKHRLRVAPALPGVRPIDVTSNRMERIMRLGHGSHRRNPKWTWAFMLIAGICVLPGAVTVIGQTPAKPSPVVPREGKVVDNAPETNQQKLKQPRESESDRIRIEMTIMEVNEDALDRLSIHPISKALITSDAGVAGILSIDLKDDKKLAADASPKGESPQKDSLSPLQPNQSIGDSIGKLKREGLLTVLSRPQIMTVSGRPATIQIGQALPPGAADSAGNDLNPTQDKPAFIGISANVFPRMQPDGSVRLEIRLERSELDPERGISTKQIDATGKPQTIQINAIKSSWIETAAKVKLGTPLLIGGPSREQNETRKVNRAEGTTKTKKRMIVLLTCHLVVPSDKPNGNDHGNAPAPAIDASAGEDAVSDPSVQPGRQTLAFGQLKISGDLEIETTKRTTDREIHVRGQNLRIDCDDADRSPWRCQSIRGDHGLITLRTNEHGPVDLVQWQFHGNVVVEIERQKRIAAESLRWSKDDVISGSLVKINLPTMKLTADEMTIDLANDLVQVKGNVMSTGELTGELRAESLRTTLSSSSWTHYFGTREIRLPKSRSTTPANALYLPQIGGLQLSGTWEVQSVKK